MTMKKYVFVYHGNWIYTDEMKAAWADWFAAVGDNMVDGGSPLGPGVEVTPGEMRDMSGDSSPAVGYSIFNAESMDAAVALLEGCPIVDSVRVYEAMSM